MIDLEEKERRLLQAARRAFSPAEADARRVLAATRAALAGNASATRSTQAPEAPASMGTAVVGASGIGLRGWLTRAAVCVSIAGASGAVGYQLGLRASRAEHERTNAAADATPRNRSAPPPPPRVQGIASQPKTARRDEVAAPAVADSRPAPTPRQESRPSRRVVAPSSGVAAASLQEELRVLRRVERALRDGEPRLALELLGELERSVPGGQLQEERFAAFMMGRCVLGAGSAPTLVGEFAARYPDSVYLARVQQACALVQHDR